MSNFKLDEAMDLIRQEVIKATTKHGAMNSQHEGYAVTLEELDEVWDEIKANNPDRATKEMIQVGAMAVRFLLDVGFKSNI